MKLSSIKIDPARQEQGGWVDSIPGMGDLRLKVRGLGNSDYRRLQASLMDAVPRQKRVRGRIDPDEQDKIISRCLLNTVLIDWDGVLDDEDRPVAYSREMAETLLFQPEYVAFRDAVIRAADTVSEQGAEAVGDTLGNSSPASAGSSNGGKGKRS